LNSRASREPEKRLVEELFFAAKKHPRADQEAFLVQSCQGDDVLRAAVARLLTADSAPDSLFDQPIDLAEAAGAEASLDREGSVIGPYKLLQQIGEGGFGVVFMAKQTSPVNRNVALKVIKPGMDSKEVVARFEAELQALAMMDHPNIAKVLDAGTTNSGRPYFAMELVKGTWITEYCDQNQLDTTERLGLFNQVCRAVQHAHQKGIIHRDIKPSNVMVTLHDGQPVPKVIDFGVAKALSQSLTEKTLFTRYGQIVGTPQYMSPEQAEMSDFDVDTRSDIYSLGILLYELLTGQTPLDAASLRSAGYDAMRKMICEAETAKPSTRIGTLDNDSATCIAKQRSTRPALLSKSITGDLDWIVMKSLDKDRNRRYDSANGLLHDIERFLRDEPVEAGPPTFAYQLSKLYRRHQAAVTTLAGIGAALALTAAIITFLWFDANQQRQVAIAALQAAEESRAKAVTSSDEAKKQADMALGEVKRSEATLEMLTLLLSQASPDPKLGTEVKVSDFLTSFANRLDSHDLKDPKVEIDVRFALAASLARFSDFEKAKEQLIVAERVGRQYYQGDTNELAEFLVGLGWKYAGRGDSDQIGRDRLGEALRIVEQHDSDPKLQIEILSGLGSLNWAYHDVAERYFAKATMLFDQLDEPTRRKTKASPHIGLAEMLNLQDKTHEAVAAGERAIAIAKEYGDDEVVARTLSRVADIYVQLDDYDQAIRMCDSAIDIANTSGNPLAVIDGWKKRIELDYNRPVSIESQIALALRCQSQIDRNRDEFHKRPGIGSLLGLVNGVYLSSNDDRLAKHNDLHSKLAPGKQADWAGRTGQQLRKNGEIRKAIIHYKRSIDLQPGQGNLWNYINLGRAYAAVRDFESELHWLAEAQKQVTGETDPWHALPPQHSTALAMENAGLMSEARPIYASCVTKLGDHYELTWGRATAAMCLHSMIRSGMDIDESEGSAFNRAVAVLHGPTTSWPIGRAYTHAALGMVDERHGKIASAIERFIKANETRPGTFVQVHAEWITEHLVELMVREERFDELEIILRADVERRDKQLPPIHPERAFVRLRLVEFLLDNKRTTDGVSELLADAKMVYSYHSDILPHAEHKKLAELERRTQ